MVAALHMDRTFETLGDTLLPQLTNTMPNASKLPPKIKEALISAAQEEMAALTPEMIKNATSVYARTFTERELEDATAFYESASGQAMLAKQRQIAEGLAPFSASYGVKMREGMIRRFCQKISCPPELRNALSPPEAPIAPAQVGS